MICNSLYVVYAAGLFCCILLFAALFGLAGLIVRELVRNGSTRWSRAGIIVFGVSALCLAVFLLRPHEHTFQGLDSSAYRLMAKAFLEGRPFKSVDNTLQEVPTDLRRWLLLSPSEQYRMTRDRSFVIESLDSCTTKPFFYPLLPLCMIGFDILVPGEAFDYMMPVISLLFCVVCLAVGISSGGILGGLTATALLAGSPLPVWFFRGCFAETVVGILIAASLLLWIIRNPKDGPPSLFQFFALGLAVSFHPAAVVFAVPVFGIMFLEFGNTIAKVLRHSAAFSAGVLPIILMTLFVTAPYGEATWSSLCAGIRVSPSIRAVAVATGGFLFLFLVALAVRGPVKMTGRRGKFLVWSNDRSDCILFFRWSSRKRLLGVQNSIQSSLEVSNRTKEPACPELSRRARPAKPASPARLGMAKCLQGGYVASGLLLGFWVLPTLLTIKFWGQGPVVLHGLHELVDGLCVPFGAGLIFFCLYLLIAKQSVRAKTAVSIIFISLPVFLYMDGAEHMGLWSQRRLIASFLIVFSCCLPSAASLVRRVTEAGAFRTCRILAVVLALSIMGFSAAVKWPAPYFVRYDHGADEFVDRLRKRLGNRLALFDWYHYSVPLAVYGDNRVLGLSEAITRKKQLFGCESFREDGFSQLIHWLRDKAGKEEVLWVTSFQYPEMEDGLVLDPVAHESVMLARITGEHPFPAIREQFEIKITLLRLHPIEHGQQSSSFHKIMDGGILGLRGPWGRKDMRYFIKENGFRTNYWIDEPYFSSTVNDMFRDGWSLPGCFGTDGHGFIGPVPSPGRAARVTLTGISDCQTGAVNQNLWIHPPWVSDPAVVSFSNRPTTASVIIRHPSNDMTELDPTGFFYLYQTSRINHSISGKNDFKPGARIWIHEGRIELVEGPQ